MIRALLGVVVAAWLVGGCKGEVSTSSPEMGTFMCAEVNKGLCVGPTDRFQPSVPVVHVLHRTTDVPRNGDVYEIQWIAEDVGQAAPPNSVITTVDKEVTEVVAGGTYYTLTSHLTKPTNGWPVGQYRVEIGLGGKPVTTARFAIR